MYSEFITYLIVIFGTVNILRIGFFMIGSDIYTVKEALRVKKQNRKRITLPTFSVVIPAHNEESTIINCVNSVANSDYPIYKLQIIVADDGSTDDTAKLLIQYQQENGHIPLKVITQPNAGKAHALNNAMANYATGKLIMCLDADS